MTLSNCHRFIFASNCPGINKKYFIVNVKVSATTKLNSIIKILTVDIPLPILCNYISAEDELETE